MDEEEPDGLGEDEPDGPGECSYCGCSQCRGTWLIVTLQLGFFIIIIEKHTSEGAKEQTQHKLSYMVEAEDTIKSNSD